MELGRFVWGCPLNFFFYLSQDTETLKQSPTDTITQYAYNLMSHQTKIAQKCLDDRAGRYDSLPQLWYTGTVFLSTGTAFFHRYQFYKVVPLEKKNGTRFTSGEVVQLFILASNKARRHTFCIYVRWYIFFRDKNYHLFQICFPSFVQISLPVTELILC